MELFDDTDKEQVLAAATEPGITTRGMNIEGVTTAVNLIDDNDNSDNDDESEPLSLEDPDLSDDEDSDKDDNDDAGGDAQAINHISVTENANSGRQERVNQADNGAVNHIPISENTNGRRQERGNVVTETNVNPWGRAQIILPATAGITSTSV